MSETSKAGQPAKKHFLAEIEEQILDSWQKEKTFEKSIDSRRSAELFAFNDGPPFANGQPHFGHSLVTAVKDAMLRYKTMRGLYVPRRNGWDCHGLPVEFDIEKQFDVSGKKQILELGLEKFNTACRASIFKYKADWEDFLTRIGRWSDYEHYYATVDTTYTESVWWILSEIYKKGLLYRGFKSLPYCPRCETPLSNFELNEGYKDDVPDPSVFVLFPLKDDLTTKLLAWTTTPWTLPANAALAVDAKADYAYVELKSDGSTLILAKKRLAVLDLRKGEYKLVKAVKGQDLVGLRYQSLYGLPAGKFSAKQVQNAHQVFADAAVDLDDGTGILHVAPRYGETDLALGLKENLPLIESVDGSGRMVQPELVAGEFFKAADEHIIADLTHKERIFAAESNFSHTYPFCWRCETPLMYFATSTWFVEVTKVKEDMLKAAEDINWVPSHIKTGRFGKWLEGARDWAISRNRYWGAPMPIWQNVDDENDYIIVGSLAELAELAGSEALQKLPKVEGKNWPDVHRPYIDDIVIKKDGKTYKRIEEVLDCWFESGSMPIAQWHYPFENKDKFNQTFPADFITEAIDQTRLWFYVQHVISTILFKKPAYKQVIVTGFMMAADGQKLSKRLRNYPPVEEVFASEGADSLRLYLLSRTQATETADYMRFDRSAMVDIQRNVLLTLYNSYKFFQTYAKIDEWSPPKQLAEPSSDNILDKWILARLNQTVAEVSKSADKYEIAHAILPIFNLIDDLSNWYVRRSRRRFWKSQNDADKQQAYATLHYVLIRTSQIMAPWAPFISDYFWRQLTQAMELPKSIHLSNWLSVSKPDTASQKLLEQMVSVRSFVATGLAKRAAAKIKVRQPLQSAKINNSYEKFLSGDLQQIIKDELNIKELVFVEHKGGVDINKSFLENLQAGNFGQVTPHIELNTKITDSLKKEGVAREVIRNVQNARKNAGLNVEDRIKLNISSDSKKITRAVSKFRDIIFTETLATGELKEEGRYSETVKVEGQEVKISLSKA